MAGVPGLGRAEVETEEGGVREGGGLAIPLPETGLPEPPAVSPVACLPGWDPSRRLASTNGPA